MPIYEIETPDGRIMEIEGPTPPSLEIVKKAYAKLPPIQQQEPEPEKLSRGASIARTLVESQFPGLAAIRDRDIKEEARNILDIASYMPTPAGLTSKMGLLGKIAAETVPQAAASGAARYIGEREKGVYPEEALQTAATQAATEVGVGAGITGAGKGITAGLRKIGEQIPEDLYSKAREFVSEKAKPLDTRIKQLKEIGSKALKRKEAIDIKQENIADKAAKDNKAVAKNIASKMIELSKKFTKQNEKINKPSLISNISEKDLSGAIQDEYNKLLRNAEPLIENGGISRNVEAENLLEDFRKRFMTRKKVVTERFIPDPTGYGRGRTEKVTEEIYTPIKNRKKFFDEMRFIVDKGNWEAGERAIGQNYARVHESLNRFLKENSEKYAEHKKLGKAIVDFSKLKPEISEEYNTNKVQDALSKALNTFKKNPDPDSIAILQEYIEQAKKEGENLNLKKILDKYEENINKMEFKGSKSGMTEKQIEALNPKVRDEYLKNKDLSELSDEATLFKKGTKAEDVATEPSRMGRILDLIREQDKALVRNIETEEAKRAYDALTKGLFMGDIPLISPFLSPQYQAAQTLRKAIKTPKFVRYAKEFTEGDTRITPEMVGAVSRLGGRAASRSLFGTDDQRVDYIKRTGEMRKRRPFEQKSFVERYKDGTYTKTFNDQIKRERGVQ